MDALEYSQNNCRICLNESAILDWHEEITGASGTNYKCCYYRYTQLEEHVSDPYSQMLCESCSVELKNVHFLVQKALDSHYILQQTLGTHSEKIDNTDDDKWDIKQPIAEFETVFYKKSPESSICDDDDDDDYYDNKDFFTYNQVETSVKVSRDVEKLVEKKSKTENINSTKTSTKVTKGLPKKPVYEASPKVEQVEKRHAFPKEQHISASPSNSLSTQDKATDDSIENKKITCAYCPKLFLPRNLKSHEDLHKRGERNVVCPKCGVKFFEKSSLHSHMMVHDKDRVKRFKCEFCDKAYFNSGALSLHKRKHLGKMVYCPLCSKEFYRQHELNKHHISAHSAALPNANLNKSKYFVVCKDCGKNVASHRWKHHQLLHSNNYQMKCNLCDKHFASKLSCHRHVRRFHKYMDDFAKVVDYYGEDVNRRSSFLLLSQTQLVKPILEEN